MQYTQNYKLKKPEGADQVNIQDFNDNAEIMDAELKKRPVSEGGEISSTIARFEDYTGSVTLPDSETALGNIRTGGKLSVLFQNVKAVLTGAFLKKYILKTMEEVMANTVAGRTADALLLKEINSNFDGLFGDGIKKTMSLINSGNTLRTTMYNDTAGTYITSRNFATGIATRLSITDNHLSLDKFTFTVRPDGSFADVSSGSSTIV